MAILDNTFSQGKNTYMKKEYALTILLSTPFPTEITLKRIEHILKSPVNWNEVFSLSLLERTTFFICKNLLQYHYFWSIPDSLWIVWNAAYIGNIKKNEHFICCYNILYQTFVKHNIEAFPVNGTFLLKTIYKDMEGIRLLHDLDFYTEKHYLFNIDKILLDLGYQKIYINDKDFLINSFNPKTNNILYSKYVNSTYINCDFSIGINKENELYNFIIMCMKEENTSDFYIAHLILLYLSAEKTWNGKYIFSDVRQYTYSRLIDLHLYKSLFINFQTYTLFEKVINSFNLSPIIQNVEKALNFFVKEGYLI